MHVRPLPPFRGFQGLHAPRALARVAALVACAALAAACGSDASPAARPGAGAGGGWRATVGAGGVFARTFDDASWEVGGAATFDLYAVSCVGSDKGWAGGAGGIILHTQDAGATWARQAALLTADLHAIRVADDGMQGIVAGDSGALATTVDGGVNWQARTPSTMNLHGVAIATGAGLLLAVGDGGTVIKSKDHGATWTRTPFSNTSNLRAVATDRAASLVLVADSSGAIFASTDGAATFARETTAPAALFALDLLPDASHALAAGAAGTVLERDSGGAWTPAASGVTTDLYAALLTTSGRAYVAGDAGVLATRTTGAWSPAPVTATAKLYAIDGR